MNFMSAASVNIQPPGACRGSVSCTVPDRRDPAERLFNPLAQDQTDRVARMPRGATVNGGGAAIVVLRDVRGRVEDPHVGDEAASVEQLIGTDRDAVPS